MTRTSQSGWQRSWTRYARGIRASKLRTASFFLRLFAVLDDVARLEEDAAERLPPGWLAPKQELQVHAKVLELLLLGVPHDRPRLLVSLDGETLRVPVDRFGLLDQRSADAREGANLFRELIRRLVVLLSRHGRTLSRVPTVTFSSCHPHPEAAANQSPSSVEPEKLGAVRLDLWVAELELTSDLLDH